MANNQYVNKVQYDGNTLIDLTADTAIAEDVAQGKYFHLATGERVQGTASSGPAGIIYITDTVDANGGTVRSMNTDGATITDTVDEHGGTVRSITGVEVYLQSKTVQPTESAQSVTPDTGYGALGAVNVGAIPSNYVGSGVTQRTSSDLTASGATVTAPAGYYSSAASKSVASGTAGTPTASKGSVSNHSISITPSVTNTAGYIDGGTKTGTAVSVSASELVSGTKSISANGTDIDVTNYASVDVAVPSPSLQAKTSINPTTSSQTITPDSGYDGLSSVQINAMPSGTAGTPTATKSSVSNHAVSVTPSVTNTTGYISGGTKTGTAVSVSASELVSGSYTVSASGTHDVTNYASASVAAGGATASASKGSVSNHSVSVTPSVTRTAGYITAGSSDGTAVTVTASELASGNKEITSNGTNIDVVGYSTVSVDVTGHNVYTATISGNGHSTYCYVQKNHAGSMYYTDGDTLTFEDGDYLYIRVGGSSGRPEVSVNGTLVFSSASSTDYYSLNNPRCDLTIEFTYSTNSSVNIVVPTPTTITESGIQQTEGKPYVNIASIGETELRNYLLRDSSLFKTITWPSDVQTIGPYAFAGCMYFNVPSLPSTLTKIGERAFYNCRALSITSLPSGVTSIGSAAFQDNFYLALTSLPSGLKTIGSDAFYGCLRMTIASLPSGLTTISSSAFYNCSSMTVSSIPSSVTSIGSNAFYGCTGITISTVPSGITTINTAVFRDCTSITSFTVPSGVTTINASAFLGCTSLATLSLPDTLTIILGSAFQNCTSLTTVSCDAAITSMLSAAFNGDSTHSMALTSASFPNLALASNLGTVFGNSTSESACQSLAFCDIGNATGIAANAFANCYSLTKLVIRKTSVCTLANTSAFTNTPMSGYNGLTGTVYVPSSLISSYQTATNWKTLYNNGTVTFTAIEGSDYEL